MLRCAFWEVLMMTSAGSRGRCALLPLLPTSSSTIYLCNNYGCGLLGAPPCYVRACPPPTKHVENDIKILIHMSTTQVKFNTRTLGVCGGGTRPFSGGRGHGVTRFGWYRNKKKTWNWPRCLGTSATFPPTSTSYRNGFLPYVCTLPDFRKAIHFCYLTKFS